QFLFLPCELQQGHHQDGLTSECGVPFYKAFTIGQFSLIRDREKKNAIMFPGGEHRVKGELWAIVSNHIPKLDRYKSNGVQFLREKLDVLVPYSRIRDGESKQTMIKLPAWAYKAIPEFW